jgi:hypothetical protein
VARCNRQGYSDDEQQEGQTIEYCGFRALPQELEEGVYDVEDGENAEGRRNQSTG